MTTHNDSEAVRQKVREGYGKIAGERRLVLRPGADVLRFNAGGVRRPGQAHRL